MENNKNINIEDNQVTIKENSNITSPVEEVRRCRICKKVLPISKFDRFGKRGYHTSCKACEGKECGTDERFKDITSRDLIIELRARGYKGKLQKVTIDEVVI